jgi:hypothetical protein
MNRWQQIGTEFAFYAEVNRRKGLDPFGSDT